MELKEENYKDCRIRFYKNENGVMAVPIINGDSHKLQRDNKTLAFMGAKKYIDSMNPIGNEKTINWGFDLTGFKSAKEFQYIIDKYNLKYKKTAPYKEDNRYSQFNWSNKDVEIVTGNNPITGEYTNPNQRKVEKGYASYIGITGKKYIVMEIVAYIKKNANIKGESPNNRDFI